MPVTVKVVRIVLRILTFRLGTLLLCGLLSFDKKNWPSLLKFSDISLEKREKILQRWNIQWYNPLARIAFLMIKAMFLFYYFTWVKSSYFLCISKIECDAVVVGSACGGGVAAANLAKSGLRVVVLEKGNYFVPQDYSTLEGPSMFEMFELNSLLMTHDGRFRFMAGSTVGGGSVVNWAASLKTPDAEKGFRTKFCEKLGLDVTVVPRNSSEKHYCGSCSSGCKTGDKRGTDSTWLVDAVNNNALILTQCKAEKLILVDNDAEERRETGLKKKMFGSDSFSIQPNQKEASDQCQSDSCGLRLAYDTGTVDFERVEESKHWSRTPYPPYPDGLGILPR